MWLTLLAAALPYAKQGVMMGVKYLETRKGPTPQEVSDALAAAHTEAQDNLAVLVAEHEKANKAADDALDAPAKS